MQTSSKSARTLSRVWKLSTQCFHSVMMSGMSANVYLISLGGVLLKSECVHAGYDKDSYLVEALAGKRPTNVRFTGFDWSSGTRCYPHHPKLVPNLKITSFPEDLEKIALSNYKPWAILCNFQEYSLGCMERVSHSRWVCCALPLGHASRSRCASRATSESSCCFSSVRMETGLSGCWLIAPWDCYLWIGKASSGSVWIFRGTTVPKPPKNQNCSTQLFHPGVPKYNWETPGSIPLIAKVHGNHAHWRKWCSCTGAGATFQTSCTCTRPPHQSL